MSRLLRLVLLVSLGLNLGLGWAALRGRDGDAARPGREGSTAAAFGRNWRERPAPDDTAAWRRMMHHRIERLEGMLDLDPDQAEQLRLMQAANGPLMRQKREGVEAARQAVRASANGGDFDEARVRAALRDLRLAQAGLDSLAQEFLMQEFSVLDPGQRARYLEMLPLDPWRSPRGGGRGGPDGPGGGNGPDDPGDGPRHGGGRRRAQE